MPFTFARIPQSAEVKKSITEVRVYSIETLDRRQRPRLSKTGKIMEALKRGENEALKT